MRTSYIKYSLLLNWTSQNFVTLMEKKNPIICREKIKMLNVTWWKPYRINRGDFIPYHLSSWPTSLGPILLLHSWMVILLLIPFSFQCILKASQAFSSLSPLLQRQFGTILFKPQYHFSVNWEALKFIS